MMDLGWKLRRLFHLARRITGSIAMRGWKGTLKRALRSHDTDEVVIEPVAVLPPAPGFPPRRILVIDTMTPDPTRDSGSMRLCQIFSLLHADGWSIDFLADYGNAPPPDVARLARLGVALRREPPLHWIKREAATLDAVMLCRLPVADQYLAAVRRHAPQARLLFDTVDLHFVREQRAAALTGASGLARQARRTRRRELSMVRSSDVTLVVSKGERDILSAEVPSARVEVVSNIHEVHGRTRGFEGRTGLLFIGGFGHPPNEDAVRWFANQVLPILRERDPDIVFHVAGDIDASARRSIARPGVIVHGRVADLAPLLDQSLLSVAPLRFGAGVKGKVNQAMSHGLPVVLTTIAAEGMHLTHEINAMIADDADGLAKAILDICADPALWARLSDNGLDNIRRHFSVEHARAALRNALGTHTP